MNRLLNTIIPIALFFLLPFPLIAADDDNVTIEFLVVEYIHGNSFEWGIDITSGTVGRLSDIAYAPGAVDNTLSFSYDFLNQLDPSFKLNLKALIGNNYASIVSNPHISVKDKQPAIIQSKETKYILLQVASINGLTTELQELDAGITLNATPTIINDSIVHLDVDGEVSEFIPFSESGEYSIESNHINTQINVKAGQTLIIGGLIKREEMLVEGKVPILGSIPLLGLLFKRKNTVNRETELVIYITPHIHAPNVAVDRKFGNLGEELHLENKENYEKKKKNKARNDKRKKERDK